jgi:hypothetical protein
MYLLDNNHFISLKLKNILLSYINSKLKLLKMNLKKKN